MFRSTQRRAVEMEVGLWRGDDRGFRGMPHSSRFCPVHSGSLKEAPAREVCSGVPPERVGFLVRGRSECCAHSKRLMCNLVRLKNY